jgi:hypothetical protein
VALGTVSDIVALITTLRIIKRLNRMDLPEIGSVGFGDIAGDIIRNAQIRRNAAAFVAIETELLVMAVCAVPAGTAGKEAVLPHLIRPVGRCNAGSLVTVRAFF